MGRFNAWVVVLAVGGCGIEKSPVEKCDDLVGTLCTRGVQCLGGAYSECVQAVKAELPCGSARQVSASYDRCIEQLEGGSCSVLFPTNPQTGQAEIRLPADCNAVILNREAPATDDDADVDRERMVSVMR